MYYSPILGLQVPEQDDIYDIGYVGYNADILDRQFTSDDGGGTMQDQLKSLMRHVQNLAVKIHFNNTAGTDTGVELANTDTGTTYDITDITETTYITEVGTYTATCLAEGLMVSPESFEITKDDLTTHRTLRIISTNGYAYVGGYVGAYTNK